MNPPSQASNMETVSFLGLRMQPKTMAEMNELLEQGIRERQKWIVANHNLHSVYLFHKHPRMREFYSRADYTYVDGMPLVAMGRLYGYPLQRDQRLTNADWTRPLMKLAAQKGWRVFNVGSPRDVAQKGAENLRKLCPTLELEVADGYFDATPGSPENEALIARINAFKPDVLMVGLGMPRQEYWTLENYSRLNAHIILSSNGAALDYVAGAVPTPPRWSGRLGLEWAFRLVNEPRRLFSRYCLEPWYVLMLLMFDYPRSRPGVKLRARGGLRGSGDLSAEADGLL
jgi:N-acetylglucosaminyldiphosphoundecaprenol N-acetyl-beta-D-mannosaminyltransferase